MTCNLLMDMSTRKRFLRTQTTGEQFLLIILQLKYCRCLSVMGVAYVGREIRGHTNYTRVQLNILSTCVSLSPAGSSGA